MGLRTAKDSALPAFLGSRAACRPMVQHLIMKTEAAKLASVHDLMSMYDQRTEAAWHRHQYDIPAECRDDALEIIQEAARSATKSWDRMMSATNDEEEPDSNRRPSQQRAKGTAGAGIVDDAGDEDPEHPHGRKSGPAGQHFLQMLSDECAAEGLGRHFDDLDAGADRARLTDLRDKSTDHCWLWSICSRDEDTSINNEEFAEAVRIRLGAGGPTEAIECRNCGNARLDSAGIHASKCCIGEATVGHNLVKEIIHKFAARADAHAELEPPHLVRSRPADRPADILTAATGRLSALDVGITSSALSAAGADAAEAMWRKKTKEREPIRDELEQSGIIYTPLVWTHHGRAHEQANTAIKAIARSVARRWGGSPAASERGLRERIGIALARRAARMSLATWSRDADRLGTEEEFECDAWQALPSIARDAKVDDGGALDAHLQRIVASIWPRP